MRFLYVGRSANRPSGGGSFRATKSAGRCNGGREANSRALRCGSQIHVNRSSHGRSRGKSTRRTQRRRGRRAIAPTVIGRRKDAAATSDCEYGGSQNVPRMHQYGVEMARGRRRANPRARTAWCWLAMRPSAVVRRASVSAHADETHRLGSGIRSTPGKVPRCRKLRLWRPARSETRRWGWREARAWTRTERGCGAGVSCA